MKTIILVCILEQHVFLHDYMQRHQAPPAQRGAKQDSLTCGHNAHDTMMALLVCMAISLQKKSLRCWAA